MTAPLATAEHGSFRHEALLYRGDEEFGSRVASFIDDAIAADAPTLVVVSEQKIAALRAAIGGDHELVRFADMAQVGDNPARIIPYWHDFVDEHAGRAVRGVGEPISPDRGAAELVECQHHEALLNVAFADASAFHLVCPYDTAALPPDVIAAAHRSHPFVVGDDEHTESDAYPGTAALSAVLDAPLPEPSTAPAQHTLRPGKLKQFRAFVADQAQALGLDRTRAADLVIAANEVASNSLLYGGGGAGVRMWLEDAVICEVSDNGHIANAMTGRRLPGDDEHDSRGMWMVNQLCDLAQVRSSESGTVVRLHMRLN